jgi:adenine-specific DNA-methyltransferase
MVYLDPPYGIKFGSNWQVSTRKRDVKDGKAEDTTRQPEQVRAFRDTWKLGVHSYLAYLRDRLAVVRELLTESGSIFVQIGDENVHLVRNLLDEIFGSENFQGQITFRVKSPLNVSGLGRLSDYLLWYGKNYAQTKYRQLYTPKLADEQGEFNMVELQDGQRLTLTNVLDKFGTLPHNAKQFTAQNLASSGYTESCTFDFKFDNRIFKSPGGKSWKTNLEGMNRLAMARRLHPLNVSLRYVYFIEDFPMQEISNLWIDTFAESEKSYVVQTATKVIERCLLMTTDPGDLVLDPTCGSGTTAFVAEQWGRRWITCDTSRVAIALARTRLMAAKFPFYLLFDSPDGLKRESELIGKLPPNIKTGGDIKRGFIYKRVPHVTLKSIANNPDVMPAMSRAEIDAAIARHADTELLYDQPYEDNKRIRVTGPFTVESLSPHRFLSADEHGDGSASEQEARQHHDFATMILDNLRKAGIQNTHKNERLKFDSLESFAGTWLHATGTYTDKDDHTRRVAVCIGPEHGTVGPDLVKEAAKEAVQGVGFDLLVVCGFAFDPHVNEEVKRYGKLSLMIARMNPDLAMGDELLKKTGAGNLFMVFGEPDVEIKEQPDGRCTAEIKGVDVYDPTTGQIRNSSTDDIACWFIDTDYNGESFFVRHAYFTGADEPYEKLKRALRADIDEAAWSTLYSTVSTPFPKPKTGKIAVKVINHYGDEVLKVFKV